MDRITVISLIMTHAPQLLYFQSASILEKVLLFENSRLVVLSFYNYVWSAPLLGNVQQIEGASLIERIR